MASHDQETKDGMIGICDKIGIYNVVRTTALSEHYQHIDDKTGTFASPFGSGQVLMS